MQGLLGLQIRLGFRDLGLAFKAEGPSSKKREENIKFYQLNVYLRAFGVPASRQETMVQIPRIATRIHIFMHPCIIAEFYNTTLHLGEHPKPMPKS